MSDISPCLENFPAQKLIPILRYSGGGTALTYDRQDLLGPDRIFL